MAVCSSVVFKLTNVVDLYLFKKTDVLLLEGKLDPSVHTIMWGLNGPGLPKRMVCDETIPTLGQQCIIII